MDVAGQPEREAAQSRQEFAQLVVVGSVEAMAGGKPAGIGVRCVRRLPGKCIPQDAKNISME